MICESVYFLFLFFILFGSPRSLVSQKAGCAQARLDLPPPGATGARDTNQCVIFFSGRAGHVTTKTKRALQAAPMSLFRWNIFSEGEDNAWHR